MLLGTLQAQSDGENPRSTVTKLAQDISASETHVAKVVARLAELGVVDSARGRGGGVRLAESAHDMRLGKLLYDLENARKVIDCSKPDACPFEAYDCALYRNLERASRAFYDELDRLSLGDLIAETIAQDRVYVGLPEVG